MELIMENLLFSMGATMPIFLMMILGAFLRKQGIIDEEFAAKINRFVFLVPLPALVFDDLRGEDFRRVFDLPFFLFCLGVTILCILIAIGLSLFLKERGLRGEFIQASYRSSAALIGMAFLQSLYGKTTAAAVMIIASVPLYNVVAVMVLCLLKPGEGKIDKKRLRETLVGVVKNPIIIAIVIGILWSFFRIPMPLVLEKSVESVSNLATPLGLMAMGASFTYSALDKEKVPVLCATFLKLIGFAALFLPVAIGFGFRTEKLVTILVMLGSATTVTSYIMAKNLGNQGSLTAGAVTLTTFLSPFTLTAWLFLLRTLRLV